MGSNSAAAFASAGMNYGEYMPQRGAIYGAAVNWATTNISGLQYQIYAVNYGPGVLPMLPFGINITSSSSPSGQIPTGGPGNWRGSNSVWEKTAFNAGDYIGIYIVPVGGLGSSGGQIKDPIEIEGTIYLRFDNDEVTSQNSSESGW